MEFVVERGNIAEQSADALVNAAGTNLLMETGAVGSALLEAAGPAINEAAVAKGPIELGEVAVTDAYGLDADHVVHAAAAHYGGESRARHIRAATRNALREGEILGCESLAMPAIGCGVAGFPLPAGSRLICEEIVDYDPDSLADVTLVGYEAEYEVLASAADEVRRA